jgi:hypothetical protein
MTTEHTVVRSGKSERKPFNSNVADYLLIIATFAFSYPPRADRLCAFTVVHPERVSMPAISWSRAREKPDRESELG